MNAYSLGTDYSGGGYNFGGGSTAMASYDFNNFSEFNFNITNGGISTYGNSYSASSYAASFMAAPSTVTSSSSSGTAPAADPVDSVALPPVPNPLPDGVESADAWRESIRRRERERREQAPSAWGGLRSVLPSWLGGTSRPTPPTLEGNDPNIVRRRNALNASRNQSNRSFWKGFLWGAVKTVAITVVAAVVVTAAVAATGLTLGAAAPLIVAGAIAVGAAISAYQLKSGLEAKDKADKKIDDAFVNTTDRREATRLALQIATNESQSAGDDVGQGTVGLLLSLWSAGKMVQGARAGVTATRAAATAAGEQASVARQAGGAYRGSLGRVPTRPPGVSRFTHARASVSQGFGSAAPGGGRIMSTVAVAPAIGSTTTGGITWATSIDPELQQVAEEEGLVAAPGSPVGPGGPAVNNPGLTTEQIQAQQTPFVMTDSSPGSYQYQ